MGTPGDPFSPDLRLPRHFWQPVVFSALFFILALGAVLYFVNIAADRENTSARNNSLHLAQTAVETLSRDIVGRAIDYAWWDDMVAQAAHGIDPAWADNNIGKYLQDQFGYTGSYVLGRSNQTLYVSSKIDGQPDDGMAFLGPAAAAFIGKLRPVPASQTVSASTFVSWKGRVYLVAAGSITAEEPSAEQLKDATRPILVLFRVLDDTTMETLGGRFLLDDFRLTETNGADSVITLSGPDGGVAAMLTWTQARPGDALFKDLAVTIGAVTLGLAIAAVLLAYVWARSAIIANLAKSRFLAKMSHELLTPLNPIIGFAQIMSAEMLGPLSERYRGYADDIERSGRHLQAVVQDVLDFSRIETGDLQLDESVIELAALVRELPPVMTYRPSPCGTGTLHALPLRTEIAENLPRFMGDERRIRQILINVLSNAAKFSDGKEVTLRASLDNGAVRIEIEDQGIGIASSDIPKAFEPFVQLSPDGGRTRSRSGAGIGLTICRDLVQMHGGTLDLESDVGRGTKAVIVFPPARTAAAAVSGTA